MLFDIILGLVLFIPVQVYPN